MTNQNNELDDILDVLYMQGEDAGKLNYGSAVHQITAVNGAKQAIQALYAPKPVEIIERWQNGVTKYSYDGGETWVAKPVENGELREQVLTEFKQVHKLAPADYTENCTNVVMSIIQAHTNAEIAKVLDRAKQRFHEPIEHDGSYISISVIDKTFDELIQAERAKLKEGK